MLAKNKKLKFVTMIYHVVRQTYYNLLIDFVHMGKLDRFIFSYHNETNINGNMLKDFITDKNVLSLNTHFKKKFAQLNKKNRQINYQIIIYNNLTMSS